MRQPTRHTGRPVGAPSRQAAPVFGCSRCLSLLIFVSWAFCAAFAGCASHADRVRQAREMFYAGDVVAAAQQFEKQLSRFRTDRDVVALDMATTKLFSGQTQQAEQAFRSIRDRFDDLEEKNVAESAASFLTDDNQRAYAGEDYEKILIRVMLAMSSLMGDGMDAEAYSLQISEKQQQIIDAGATQDGQNPKLAYQRVAVGAYLRGVLREATHGNYDDVERSFLQVVSWQPTFVPGHFDLQRARAGVHSAAGNGVLYVFAFVGRGPYKQEVAEVPTSEALLVADRIISVTANHTLPPTLVPIKIPRIVVSRNDIEGVQIAVGGQPAGETQTITDVGQLAIQQYQAIYPYVMGRAVARRAIKKAAVYSAKSSMQTSGLMELAMDGVGVAWEAMEAADTRSWALLPNTIQVLRVELPAGEHRVSLRPVMGHRPLGADSTVKVQIENGRNSYLAACYPGVRLAGQVLVSHSP